MGRNQKPKTPMTAPLSRDSLRQRIENTYHEAMFFCRFGVEDDCDFSQGRSTCRTEKVGRDALLEMVKENGFDPVIVAEPSDYYVLNKTTALSRRCLSDNQIYETVDIPEGYVRHDCKYNPFLHVYINLDKESKIISFLLGSRVKTLRLVEHTGYVSKPTGNRMLCTTIDDLEKHIQDEWWNPRMIWIGRYVLGIDEII